MIDTSAIVAVLLKEPGFERFIDCIASDPVRLISAVNSLESAIVIEARKGDQGGRELDLLLHKAKIDIVPFTPELADEARSAWRKYGTGNHPAGLNWPARRLPIAAPDAIRSHKKKSPLTPARISPVAPADRGLVP